MISGKDHSGKGASLLTSPTFWWAMVVVGAALSVAASLYPNPSDDYLFFLHPWISHLSAHGHWRGVATVDSNYNPPYLFMLASLSRLPQDCWLMGVRLISLAFTIGCGVMIGRLVELYRSGRWIMPCAIALTLLLPTALANWSVLAQCDAIYSLFTLAAIYFLAKRRFSLSVVMIAVAITLKFQGVFLLPLYMALLIRGRGIKWLHCLWGPATYLLLVIPSALLGRPLSVLFTDYFTFMPLTEPRYDWNFSNLFFSWCNLGFGTNAHQRLWSWIAVALIFAGSCALGLWLRRHRDRVNPYSPEFLVVSSFVIMGIVPLILPNMHERYMFQGDLLAIAMLLYYPRKWPLAMVYPLISSLCYLRFLSPRRMPISPDAITLLYVAGMIAITAYYLRYLRKLRNFAP